MVETNNKKILVNAGSLKYQDKFLDEWKKANIILITHKNGDHIKSNVLKDINISIYSTNEVQNTYPEIKFNIIKETDIQTYESEHINQEENEDLTNNFFTEVKGKPCFGAMIFASGANSRQVMN